MDAAQGIDVHDPAAVAARSGEPTIESGTDPLAPTIIVDGTDVAVAIRSAEVNAAVSPVSAVPEVRARLLEMQRAVIGEGGIVVEGRDIGSVVAPDAPVKVYITADPAARAHRRAAEEGGADLGRPRSRCWPATRSTPAGRPPRSRWPPTPSTSTPRRTRSTRSSARWWRWWRRSRPAREPRGAAPRATQERPIRRPRRWALRTLRPVGRAVFRLRFGVRVHGAEHVPTDGPVIFASNHIGVMDGPLLAAFTPRPPHVLTKIEMFRGSPGRVAAQRPARCRWTASSADPRAIKICLRVLRDGGAVGVFPEGRRGAGDLTRSTAARPIGPGHRCTRRTHVDDRQPPAGGGRNAAAAAGGRMDIVYGEPWQVSA